MLCIRDKIYYIDAWRFLNDFAGGQEKLYRKFITELGFLYYLFKRKSED